MKRSWLSLGLFFAAFGAASTYIYHVTNESQRHALAIFQENLPPHTFFHYDRANPNFLVQGITLHNVTFKTDDTFFHAKTIRLGHPKILANGRFSLSSLLIKEPSFHDSHLTIHIKRLILRHILIPSDGKLPLSSSLTAESMHSLAHLTSFNLKELANIRFDWGYSEAVAFNFTPLNNHHPFIDTLNIGDITAEGYGLGSHVRLRINHLGLNFHLIAAQLSSYLNITLPSDNNFYHTPLSYHLVVDNFEGHLGITQLLNHPFRQNIENSEHFWEDPLNILWLEPGSIHLNNLTLSQKDHHQISTFSLDSLLAERRKEGIKLNTEALLTGFHIHLAHHNFTHAINGKQTSLHITAHSHEEQGEWRSQLTTLLTIPNLGSIKSDHLISLPDEITQHLASQITFHNTELSLQGDGMITFLTSLFISQENETKNDPKNDQKNNPLLITINNLSNTRPLAAPLADYFLRSDNRILHINFGHISLETLQKIPLSGTANAIFDSLHITNIQTETPHPNP